jgi:opacity protein-like surface antigen
MKKILVILAAMMTITSVSFASPLTNYAKGKVSIDLNPNINSDSTKEQISGGITYGVGEKFAIQYKYADNKTKNYFYIEETTPLSYESGHAQLIAYEINVLYQIDPNISAYGGWARETAKINLFFNAGPSSSNIIYSESRSKNSFQLGLIGQTEFTEDLTGWASVGAGSNIIGYEIGLGYDITKNIECNVIYRYNKYKGFNFSNGDIDVKIQGVGAGVTLKF